MAGRGTPPRSAASRPISKLVGVQFGGSAGRSLSTRLGSESTEAILRGRKLSRPMLFVSQFVEEPLGDPVLFVGRQRRKLRESCVEGVSHTASIPTAAMPPNLAVHQTGARFARSGR